MSITDLKLKTLAWIKLARLQFYIVPAFGVISGAILASRLTASPLDSLLVALTIIGVWLVLFITVVTNEIYDLPTDKVNANAGAFTGGSRVLVDQTLTKSAVRNGRVIAFLLLILPVVMMATLRPESGWLLFGLMISGLILGIGYTAPPLKLVYRGLGEIAVAISQGALVLMAGFVAQGGDWKSPLIWKYSVPLCLAILPSIILGGFPDKEADEAVGKGTLVVRFGTRIAILIAGACTVLAVASHVWLLGQFSSALALGMMVHAIILIIGFFRLFSHPTTGRINGLIGIALSYVLWFFLAPCVG